MGDAAHKLRQKSGNYPRPPVRHAIIADVHANAFALRAVLGELATHGFDAIQCLGDVVGYHAQPREVIALLRERNIPSVVGNHDRMAIASDPPSGGPLARTAIEWTRGVLDAADLRWLASLPVERDLGADGLLVHSVPWSTDARLKAEEDFSAAATELGLTHPDVRICFTGHTHVAGYAHLAPDGSVTVGGPHTITIGFEPGIWFVNPGSVGLPRDGTVGARYAIWNDDTRTVTFHAAHYDMEAMNLLNRAAGLATRVPEMARNSQPTPVEGLAVLRWLSGKS
jgi:predicted phosphodiesterase